ncbi:hypothetical protein [Segnochrobactrum spirostomi]|uniref:Uncharacterized protein n=1 Tax=Segnochrobactrum spirostomi TaxID=2608987 RepID=A0A6A7XX60_9HYPH|nr:hypothetical protein [Segnochrobactrum spirostomi]MQT11134.1 hypothetical protein [Segnochrobactrum spirostomi]
MSTSVSSVSAAKLDALTRERDAALKALEEAQKARDAAAAKTQQAIVDRDTQQIADLQAQQAVSEISASDDTASATRKPAALIDVSTLKASVDAADARPPSPTSAAPDSRDGSLNDVRDDVNTLADALSRGDSDAALSASGSLSQSVRHALTVALSSPAGDVSDAKGPIDKEPIGKSVTPGGAEAADRQRDARSARAEKAYQDQMTAPDANPLGIAG